MEIRSESPSSEEELELELQILHIQVGLLRRSDWDASRTSIGKTQTKQKRINALLDSHLGDSIFVTTVFRPRSMFNRMTTGMFGENVFAQYF